MELQHVIRSAAFWTVIWLTGLVLFLTFGARPLLHLLGLLFGLMGGQGLEGTNL